MRTGWLSAGGRGGAGVAMTWAILAAAVQLGVATPDRATLAELSTPLGLDYGRIAPTLAPLSDAFVERTLGLGPTASAPLPPAADQSGPGVASRPPGSGPAPVDPGERLVVSHPPDNDRFDDAYEVPSIPFTANTDASSAARDPDEPSTCAPTGPTLWYRYVATTPISLFATTEGTEGATSLGVFRGTDRDDLRVVGCDTNITGDASVAFPSTAGTTYWFQIAAPAGGGRTVFTLGPSGVTERVSVTAAGDEVAGAYDRTQSAVTPDGRFVAFASSASDLVPGDDNGAWDVFVKDRMTGMVELVSVNPRGESGNLHSGAGTGVALSADGRYVAFGSFASDLVGDDTNDERDVFVRDRTLGETTRVSVSSTGRQGTAPPASAAANQELDCALHPLPDTPSTFDLSCTHYLTTVDISADGGVVVFSSWLWGLMDGQSDRLDPTRWLDPTFITDPDWPPTQLYAHDLESGATVRLSVTGEGQPGNRSSAYPSISADGGRVAYLTASTNLVEGDTNGLPDVLVYDNVTGVTRRVSVASDGKQGDAQAGLPDISADGRYVAFQSTATNLVDDDTNNLTDAFVHDLDTGTTERVSVSTSGQQQVAGNDLDDRRYASPLRVMISADGRRVAFESQAVNLSSGDEVRIYGDPDCQDDVFVRDRWAGTTVMASVNSAGQQANICAHLNGYSADGAHVVFTSLADNLVPDDRNSRPAVRGYQVLDGEDLFVHSLGDVPW